MARGLAPWTGSRLQARFLCSFAPVAGFTPQIVEPQTRFSVVQCSWHGGLVVPCPLSCSESFLLRLPFLWRSPVVSPGVFPPRVVVPRLCKSSLGKKKKKRFAIEK